MTAKMRKRDFAQSQNKIIVGQLTSNEFTEAGLKLSNVKEEAPLR